MAGFTCLSHIHCSGGPLTTMSEADFSGVGIEEIRRRTRSRYCISKNEFTDRMIEEEKTSIQDIKDFDLI